MSGRQYDYKAATNVRSFAERLIHAAAANSFFINSALDRKLPSDEPPRAQFKNKKAVVEYVKKSFADGAAAIKTKDDRFFQWWNLSKMAEETMAPSSVAA